MKKAVVLSGAALAVVAVLATGWWLGRRDGAATGAAAPDAGQARPVAPAETLAQRDARIRQAVAARRHLWREATYIEVRQAAMGGDVVAQRRLSEVYEDCIGYSTSLRRGFQMLPALGRANPAARETVVAVYNDYKRLCTQATADIRANPGSAQYWLHSSAKGGDLTAEMRYFARTVPTLSEEQFQHFLDKLRVSGDPDAIFEFSLLVPKLKGRWSDPDLVKVFSGSVASESWVVAACRAGYDCATGSRLLNIICLSMFSCDRRSYEEHLFASDGIGVQRQQVEQIVQLINRRVLAPDAR